MQKLTSVCEDCEKYAKMKIFKAQNFQRFYQSVEWKLDFHLKSTPVNLSDKEQRNDRMDVPLAV